MASAVVRSTIRAVLGRVRHRGDSFYIISFAAGRAAGAPNAAGCRPPGQAPSSLSSISSRLALGGQRASRVGSKWFEKNKKAVAPANRWGHGL
ncbi:hypothetical protein FHR34_005063 [Kitasatospora kifunensis]|uniref:Uncharacterized protein n=1 Tax=Kitasatospora kifunensis TaxID=58351 RepID=A0A7W7VXY2_KITKI|nr:hypothetical protein [Kitasatospora kifunensis]